MALSCQSVPIEERAFGVGATEEKHRLKCLIRLISERGLGWMRSGFAASGVKPRIVGASAAGAGRLTLVADKLRKCWWKFRGDTMDGVALSSPSGEQSETGGPSGAEGEIHPPLDG